MSKLSNELTMIKLISNRKYSINELSNILEVTPRMIRTYKSDIEMSGFIVETTMGPNGGYKILDEQQNDFLLVKQTYKKMYIDFNNAIKNKNKIEIEYYNPDDSFTNRIIEPFDLSRYLDNFVLFAYCELKGDLRQFKFNKIKSYKILNVFYE